MGITLPSQKSDSISLSSLIINKPTNSYDTSYIQVTLSLPEYTSRQATNAFMEVAVFTSYSLVFCVHYFQKQDIFYKGHPLLQNTAASQGLT